MPKRSSKKKLPHDLNQRAKAVVDTVTARTSADDATKNPAAVALGRLGGLKGGKARAKKLSQQQRTLIARRAAEARWSAKRPGNENG